jgi:tRNA 2-selenouridine synthase
VPDALIARMWASECILLEAPMAARVELLKREYAHFFARVGDLNAKLDCLAPLHGRALIDRWKSAAQAADWDGLVADLLERHYDPAYTRAIGSHYPALGRAHRVELAGTGEAAFKTLAGRCLELDARRERVKA